MLRRLNNPIRRNGLIHRLGTSFHDSRVRLQKLEQSDILWLMGGLAFLSLIFSGTSHLLTAESGLFNWLDGVFQNFGTEMIGAFVTFYFIDTVLGERRRQEDMEMQENERKVNLRIRLSSRNNETARMAAEELRRRGWHRDENMLLRADFQLANWCNLVLEEAVLLEAKLQGADLTGAVLKRATLIGADLTGAILVGAKLDGVVWDDPSHQLSTDDVEDISNITILPDGRRWTAETELARFTDPFHPEYERTLEIIKLLRSANEMPAIEMMEHGT